MNIKRTTSKCVCKKIISTNKIKDEIGQAIWKFIQQDYHTIEDLFFFWKLLPGFAFLGVILCKQHEWIKLWHQKKSNCFCQNGCLCQIWLLCQEWVWARSNVNLWNAIFKYMSWRLKSLGMNFGIKLLLKAKDLVTSNDEKIFQFLHLISCMTLHEKMHIIVAFISNSQLKHV